MICCQHTEIIRLFKISGHTVLLKRNYPGAWYQNWFVVPKHTQRQIRAPVKGFEFRGERSLCSWQQVQAQKRLTLSRQMTSPRYWPKQSGARTMQPTKSVDTSEYNLSWRDLMVYNSVKIASSCSVDEQDMFDCHHTHTPLGVWSSHADYDDMTWTIGSLQRPSCINLGYQRDRWIYYVSFGKVTLRKGLIFAPVMFIIDNISPMGPSPIDASLSSSILSKVGESRRSVSLVSIILGSVNSPILSLSCFSRNFGSKKVSLWHYKIARMLAIAWVESERGGSCRRFRRLPLNSHCHRSIDTGDAAFAIKRNSTNNIKWNACVARCWFSGARRPQAPSPLDTQGLRGSTYCTKAQRCAFVLTRGCCSHAHAQCVSRWLLARHWIKGAILDYLVS